MKSSFQIVDNRFLRRVITPEDLGHAIESVWCPSPSVLHRTEPYPVPEDIRIATWITEHAGSKLTPTPFTVVIEGKSQRTLVTVTADPGWYRWNYVDFKAASNGLTVMVDFEGHSDMEQASKHAYLTIIPAEKDESRHELFRRGTNETSPAAFAKPGQTHWWQRPIYCGWGDQVGISLKLEGPGPEKRAIAYCTQGLYERWINRLEQANVAFGTIIIDNGWSPAGVWRENEDRWPDLKGFIADQHDKGRKVLLWIPTWLHEGLPDQWCVFCDGKKLVGDPTCQEYRDFLTEHITRLLSPDGLNADGFKIDQLSFTPNEIRPRGGAQFGRTFYIEDKRQPRLNIAGDSWGGELLYLLQKHIYDTAKSAKADALISSSTVHPYFRDTYDMIRLHDTGSVEVDPLVAMEARAKLAEMVDPFAVIDADDWVHHDYSKWLRYTCNSHQIGVPCTFYAEFFVESFTQQPTVREIPEKDLQKIAQSWKEALSKP